MTELYTGAPVGAEALLGRSRGPRPRSALVELAGAMGAGPGAVVLDAGCRDGRYGVPLARRYGCRVVGVDLVGARFGGARAEAAAAGVRIAFVCGDVTALPLADGVIDLVWCRDMIEHLADPAALLRECRRVLRPGGRMLLHAVYATELFEPRERARMFDALSLAPAAMDRGTVEAAVTAAGFAVSHADQVGAEWLEYDLEHEPAQVTANLLAVSRLLRQPTELRAALGPTWYERLLAFEQWRLFLLLGKLETYVYQLVSEAAAP
jgi:ubiquinone/menaquinone biosynthesis C-methylase UbiE